MNTVVTVSGAINMERRFEDKSGAKVFADLMKKTYPHCQVNIIQREFEIGTHTKLKGRRVRTEKVDDTE